MDTIKEPETYNEHFKRLKEIAAKLQANKEPDVEELLADVKAGLASYEACRTRIDAATNELAAILGEGEPEAKV